MNQRNCCTNKSESAKGDTWASMIHKAALTGTCKVRNVLRTPCNTVAEVQRQANCAHVHITWLLYKVLFLQRHVSQECTPCVEWVRVVHIAPNTYVNQTPIWLSWWWVRLRANTRYTTPHKRHVCNQTRRNSPPTTVRYDTSAGVVVFVDMPVFPPF